MDIEDIALRKLAERLFIRRLVRAGKYSIAVSRDGKEYLVIDEDTKTIVLKTSSISEAIRYVEERRWDCEDT